MNTTPFAPFSYLATAARPLAIVIVVYYAVKAAILLGAGAVAMHTENDKRRETCLELVRIISRGWPWSPRLPGG